MTCHSVIINDTYIAFMVYPKHFSLLDIYYYEYEPKQNLTK